jgi:ArsR family transcriptional regulator, arsenate/arsenite/antimonite-responsive transcriptional repressor
MSVRPRLAGCCEIPASPPPLVDTERERIVAAFRALGDPTRLEIFRLLAAQDAPVCACDVVDRFGLSQPTISHHLRILRQAGLVTSAKRGVWAWYAPDPRALAWLREIVAGLGAPAADVEPDSRSLRGQNRLVATG